MSMYRVYFTLIFLFFRTTIVSQPIIQITFEQDEESTLASLKQKLKAGIAMSNGDFNYLINHKPESGFFATYAGSLGVSDHTGSIIFVRRHTEPVLYIAITEEITPIMRLENTVNHWEFIDNKPAIFYKLLPTPDQKDHHLVWSIQELELPHNHVIPAETIVIFGNPGSFFFNLAKSTPAYIAPNIIAPPIFVKKGTNAIESSLYLLSIKHLFASAQPEFKKQVKSFQIIPNQ